VKCRIVVLLLLFIAAFFGIALWLDENVVHTDVCAGIPHCREMRTR
jgi:hypothetical protein